MELRQYWSVSRTGIFEVILACVAGLTLGALGYLSPAAAILAVVAIGYLWISLSRPIVLGYTLIAVITFTSGMPRGRLLPLLIPNEAVLLGSFAIAFPLILIANRRRVPTPILATLSVLIVGMVVIPLTSYLSRGVGLSTSAIFKLIAPTQYVLLFLIFFTIARDERTKRRLVNFMLTCAAVVAVIGLLQSFNVPFVTSLLRQWYPSLHLNSIDEGTNRVTSVFGAWNTLGTYLMVALLLAVALLGKIQTRRDGTRLLIVSVLCGACLLVSGSFAAIGGLIFGIIIIKGFDRTGLKMILWAGLVLAVVSVVALQPIIAARLNWQYGNSRDSSLVPQTLAYRFKVWENVFLPIIARHPLGAVYPTVVNTSWGYAESQYIGLHYKTGLFSLVAHVTWVMIALIWLYKRLRSPDPMTWVAAVTVFSTLILLSIMGLTNEVFTYSGVMDYLWILVAVAVPSEIA